MNKIYKLNQCKYGNNDVYFDFKIDGIFTICSINCADLKCKNISCVFTGYGLTENQAKRNAIKKWNNKLSK